MNSCQDVELLLADFATGNLPEADAEYVAEHLAGCESCRREMAFEQRLRDGLAQLPTPAISDGAVERLQQIPAAEPPLHSRQPLTRRSWLPVAAAAALAAVLLIAILPTTGGGPRPEAPLTVTDGDVPDVTPEQIAAARRDVLWTLAKTAKIIDRSERATLSDVLGRRLPQTISGSLQQAFVNNQGGQG